MDYKQVSCRRHPDTTDFQLNLLSLRNWCNRSSSNLFSIIHLPFYESYPQGSQCRWIATAFNCSRRDGHTVQYGCRPLLPLYSRAFYRLMGHCHRYFGTPILATHDNNHLLIPEMVAHLMRRTQPPLLLQQNRPGSRCSSRLGGSSWVAPRSTFHLRFRLLILSQWFRCSIH